MSNPPEEKDSLQNFVKTQVALNALREYVYQQKPGRFLASDIIEDIPHLQPHGTHFANILPTAAIFAKNPHARKLQLDKAEEAVQKAKHKDFPVIKEMLMGAGKMGLASLPIAGLYGLGEMAFKGKLKPGIMYDSPRLNHVLDHLQHRMSTGATYGATFGAAPVLASRIPFDKHHLDTAKNVLQNHPHLASVPFGETSLIINKLNNKKEDQEWKTHLSNAARTSLWASGAAAGGQITKVLHRAAVAAGQKAYNHFGRGEWKPGQSLSPVKYDAQKVIDHILDPLHPKSLKTPLLVASLGGAAVGGVGSYLSHKNREQHA